MSSSFLRGGSRKSTQRNPDYGDNNAISAEISERGSSTLRSRYNAGQKSARSGFDSEESDYDIEEIENENILQQGRGIKRSDSIKALAKGKSSQGDAWGAGSSSMPDPFLKPQKSRAPAGIRRQSALQAAMDEEAELEDEDGGYGQALFTRSAADPFEKKRFSSHSNPAFEEVSAGRSSRMPSRNMSRGPSDGITVLDEDSEDEPNSPEVLARRELAPSQPVLGPPRLEDLAVRARFLSTPSPQDKLVQCHIVREKDPSGVYPEFKLILADGDQFLLAARRRKKSKTSNYLLSLEADDLARKGTSYFGKLRSNMWGTQYTLYNQGASPEKAATMEETRKELCSVLFKSTALDIKGGPRMMTVVVPFPEAMNQRLGITRETDPGLVKRWKKQKKASQVTVIALKNKKPVWDPVTKGYCLDFRGRVTEPSVKNFQLVACTGNDDQGTGRVVLQFGKNGPDSYVLDFSHPLTPAQAFGIALSSVDGKLCYAM